MSKWPLNLNIFPSLGFVLQPDEIGCAEVVCDSSSEHKMALNPPEILIGCHKTSDNLNKRNFNSGSFDEIAIWKRWLNDTELPFFLGGYS